MFHFPITIRLPAYLTTYALIVVQQSSTEFHQSFAQQHMLTISIKIFSDLNYIPTLAINSFLSFISVEGRNISVLKSPSQAQQKTT